MTQHTPLPPYYPFAKFLLKTDLTFISRIVYSLFLERITLSKKNRWTDQNGYYYIIYPIEKIAEDINRSPSSVKTALTELEAHGLIERVRTNFSAPNRIYIKLPDGQETGSMTARKQAIIQTENHPSVSQKSATMTANKQTFIQTENQPSISQKSDLMTAGNLSTNKISNNNHIEQPDRIDMRSPYGQFRNVFLSDKEYAAVKAACSDADKLIERLSAYMKSTGKSYADHASTLLLWNQRDKQPKQTQTSIPVYMPKEGESL